MHACNSSSDAEYAFRLILDSVPTQMPFCLLSPDQLCPSKYYFEKMREITLSRAEQDSHYNSDVGPFA
ncbi:hypothetical protein SARC_12967 [Sphaeroforma arctica JP610]|uniref:Uncharacterized protein n=1 Tax=Sphaeroforma arctica JP610 TaxID=667725 RepID=A0A0L0FEJ8_9EUKA|nr:hypothetical protein SARC_12967 [Sphaeroforma arctica JP610]KNC74488.1 hypothetical protein SARC_12967 [Sphaeroforma arctica JP610]|eukprot:XP_014148390.1 hypothetical protein SARC_12967 [Sphaeroforma arctica JP610]